MTRAASFRFHAFGGFSARQMLAFVMFLAVLFQGLVLNTHIHGTPLLYGVTQVVSADSGLPADSGTPADEQDSCPICHQVAHSGQFVTPAASALFAPLISVSVIALVIAAPFTASAPAFFWQGRAPPRI